METRVALIGIIVENSESTAQLNALLHDAGQYIIGRMGLPYRAKGVSIISVVLDAPQDVISALAGRIGRLPGVSAKTAYSKPFPPAGRERQDRLFQTVPARRGLSRPIGGTTHAHSQGREPDVRASDL